MVEEVGETSSGGASLIRWVAPADQVDRRKADDARQTKESRLSLAVLGWQQAARDPARRRRLLLEPCFAAPGAPNPEMIGAWTNCFDSIVQGTPEGGMEIVVKNHETRGEWKFPLEMTPGEGVEAILGGETWARESIEILDRLGVTPTEVEATPYGERGRDWHISGMILGERRDLGSWGVELPHRIHPLPGLDLDQIPGLADYVRRWTRERVNYHAHNSAPAEGVLGAKGYVGETYTYLSPDERGTRQGGGDSMVRILVGTEEIAQAPRWVWDRAIARWGWRVGEPIRWIPGVLEALQDLQGEVWTFGRMDEWSAARGAEELDRLLRS